MARHGDEITDVLGLPAAPQGLSNWISGRSRPSDLLARRFMRTLEIRYGLTEGALRGVSMPDDAFALVLRRAMMAHGDAVADILALPDGPAEPTLRRWLRGESQPSGPRGRDFCRRLELRYGLAAGELASAAVVFKDARLSDLAKVSAFDKAHGLAMPKALLRWHLPEDFDTRSEDERAEIGAWLRSVFVAGGDRRKSYLVDLARRYRGFDLWRRVEAPAQRSTAQPFRTTPNTRSRRSGRPAAQRPAPPGLQAEWNALAAFKTAALTPLGYRRDTTWTKETLRSNSGVVGLFLAFVAAPTEGPHAGLGADPDSLGLGLLAFPKLMEAYVAERVRLRGFASASDTGILQCHASLLRRHGGWIAQTPGLAQRLAPIPGHLDAAEVAEAQADWPRQCERFVHYAESRIKDFRRAIEAFRDPLAGVMPALMHPRPLALYRKVAEEVRYWTPNEREDALGAATSCQAFLMIRLTMQTGFRQRCLRQLLVAPQGQRPRSLVELTKLGRGELQWLASESRWEAVVPRTGFKNMASPVFAKGVYRAPLSDTGQLYRLLSGFIARHRGVLIGDRDDPGTLFVNPVPWAAPEFTTGTFFVHFRSIVAQHGIYNPYTQRGAIRGLLPHGPHAVRAVVATHVLRHTGSFEHAAYAIQDTVGVAKQYYARFESQERGAVVASVVGAVWRETDPIEAAVEDPPSPVIDEIDFGDPRVPSVLATTPFDGRSARTVRFVVRRHPSDASP